MLQRDRFVLLLGGVSGAGKTTAAIEISRRLAIPWLMVDDLRLAFQRSRVTLPEAADALYFFIDIEKRPPVWRESPERLCEALVAVGEVMAPAIEAVIEHHLDQRHPVIIEGDGILPSIVVCPSLARRVASGDVRAVFVVEQREDVLLDNMLARARGISEMSAADLRTEARAKSLFARWLRDECERALAFVWSRMVRLS
jgi:2-phosphoglycerate kinase